jgi:hypothetical protein
MPDSQLPIQGLASQPERDLDALLSGEAGYPTVVLGPVAGVLAALRAAPAPDELDGEAAARAAFRLFMLPEANVAGGAHVSAPLPRVPAQFHRVAAAGDGRQDGQARRSCSRGRRQAGHGMPGRGGRLRGMGAGRSWRPPPPPPRP